VPYSEIASKIPLNIKTLCTCIAAIVSESVVHGAMDVQKIKKDVLDYLSSKIDVPSTPLSDFLTPLWAYPTPLEEYTKGLLDLPPNRRMSSEVHPPIPPGDHKAFMQYALQLAKHSPPKSTNFRVGALIVDADKNEVLESGYTLELEGNTHAEQCCLMKLARQYNVTEEHLAGILPENTVLYTTVEPCAKRLSGNITCVERILRLGKGIKTVYVGVKEPEKFVGENLGSMQLEDAGINVVLVGGLEKRILEVATAGHKKKH
jgi:pyrimidine deaminase RibD-like protein